MYQHPPAARRGGRHHAVQLPGHGADVDVRQRPRVRQHLRPQADREGPVGRRCSWPSCWPRPACPPACFNVVHGDKEAVDGLLEHPDVAAVSASSAPPRSPGTSTRRAPRHGKRVQALGGAKNHMLVLPDADLDMAADAAVSRRLRLGRRALHGHLGRGRRRRRGRRAGRHDRRAHPGRSRSAPGNEPDTEMGPLITGEHRDKVAGYVGRRGRRGRHRRGRRPRRRAPGDGFFLGPTLLDDVKPGMAAYDDEIFGPVLSVTRVAHLRRGPARSINDNPYGNGTAIFTRDGGAARQFQFDVEVGMVGVNVPIPVPVSYYSFGGWKASLFGDTHMYGPEGVNFYTRTKVVTTRWPDPATSSIDLGFPENR